jgi:hypothetical protein
MGTEQLRIQPDAGEWRPESGWNSAWRDLR